MRIAHVTDSFLPRLGGIENQVFDLAARQLSEGHHVSVVTAAPGADGPVAGISVWRVGGAAGHTLRRATVDPLWAKRMLAAGRWDVVHCHASVVSPLAHRFAIASAGGGVPTAVTVHSLWPDAGWLLAASAGSLGLRRLPIAWSAVSEVAANPVRRALGPGTQVSVLPNAVDVQWWAGGSPAAATREGSVTAVSVLRMSTRKRPLPLLRLVAAARRLLPAGYQLDLVLAGDGPRLPAVRRHLERSGMSSYVRLVGRLDRPAVRDLLAASDLYIAPADLESFGIAALEARSVGLPIVAKRRGGVADFVRSGTEGLLAGTDRDMAHDIADLVVHTDQRRSMAAHNRANPPDHDWPAALARTGALYRRAELIARARASQHVVATMARAAASEVPQ